MTCLLKTLMLSRTWCINFQGCEIVDILRNPLIVDDINDKTDQDVDLEVIADYPAQHGWKPKIKADYVDIRFVIAFKLLAIEIVAGSNLKKYKLTIEDLKQNQYDFEVRFAFYSRAYL